MWSMLKRNSLRHERHFECLRPTARVLDLLSSISGLEVFKGSGCPGSERCRGARDEESYALNAFAFNDLDSHVCVVSQNLEISGNASVDKASGT